MSWGYRANWQHQAMSALGQQRNVYTPQEKRTVTETKKQKTAAEVHAEIEELRAAHERTIEFARDTIREARETIKREQAAIDELPVKKRRAKPKTTAGLPDAADIAHPADVPGQTMFVHLDE